MAALTRRPPAVGPRAGDGARGGRGGGWGRRLGWAGLLVTVLALCGCYSSNRLLLDPEAAVRPLDEGVYEREDAEHERVRLTREPDGWYGVERVEANGAIGETRRTLFN